MSISFWYSAEGSESVTVVSRFALSNSVGSAFLDPLTSKLCSSAAKASFPTGKTLSSMTIASRMPRILFFLKIVPSL